MSSTLVSPPQPPRSSADNTREWTGSYALLDEMLRQDSAELRREVLLWQRWIRYAAAALALSGAGALWQMGTPSAQWGALLGMAGLYLAFIVVVSALLARGAGRPISGALPAVVLAGDLVVIAVSAYLAAPPSQMHVVLLLGLLVLQLNLFYFGRRLALWAAGATLAIFLVETLLVPSRVGGMRPSLAAVVFDAIAFMLIAGVLVATFGNFRERMNALRQFCKRVEVGDLTVAFDTEHERRPDDLTLLARSVDAMRHRLIELVGTDPLTGCLNRRALEMRLKREWRSTRRRESQLAVLAVDMDNFKPINDTHGHPVGDAVLRELAQVMRSTARETDVIARVGGDEFVILLPDTGWQGATTFGERLRRQVETTTFAGEMAVMLTISIGIALANGKEDGHTAADLLQEADRSLYRAKSGGRNRVHI